MAKTTTSPARTNGKQTDPDVRVIDVDAHRAARLEILGPSPIVRLGGRDFELPRELPSEVIYAFGAVQGGDFSALERALRALFGDNFDAIQALTPAWADQEYLFQATIEAYGFTLPES